MQDYIAMLDSVECVILKLVESVILNTIQNLKIGIFSSFGKTLK